MKAISLFSGVGGFELGFERAGIETVLQAERDPWALEVLARHWPRTERVTDVRDVGRGLLQRGHGDATIAVYPGGGGDGGQSRAGSIDIVYGGFPCQDLSVAGKRAGLGGERSGLWFEFERVLRELRPRWAVIENVPGLLSSNQGRDFAVILDGLDDLGFDVAWAVLDAQHFGVPQRRRRVFIVAGPRGRGPEQVLSICESCGGNPETGGAPGADVTNALDVRAGGADDNEAQGGFLVATAITASHGVRRLTPRECERLMGWPDDHTRWTADGREIADSHRYRMAGNGVVATCAEWIGHRLVAVDGMLS